VSREGAQRGKTEEVVPVGGTPIWVWLVYGLGLLGATILVASGLFVLGAYIGSDDVPVTTNVSIPALILWGGLALAALVLWLRRRGGRAR
jgi:hypothetical protein